MSESDGISSGSEASRADARMCSNQYRLAQDASLHQIDTRVKPAREAGTEPADAQSRTKYEVTTNSYAPNPLQVIPVGLGGPASPSHLLCCLLSGWPLAVAGSLQHPSQLTGKAWKWPHATLSPSPWLCCTKRHDHVGDRPTSRRVGIDNWALDKLFALPRLLTVYTEPRPTLQSPRPACAVRCG